MRILATQIKRLSNLRFVVAVAFGLLALAISPIANAVGVGTDIACGPGGDCWQLNSSTGKVIDASNGIRNNQLFTYVGIEACGGTDKVSKSLGCPFADASLNSALNGHTIVQFQFGAFGACADSTTTNSGTGAAALVGGNCNGSHSYYIPVDNGNQFISVGNANALYNNYGAFDPDDVTYIAGIGNQQLTLSTGPQGVPNQNFNWTIRNTQ